MGPAMFNSLRARLIASYAFVVFMSLFLAGSGFLWLAQRYQEQREMERLADIVLPLSVYVRHLELVGAPASELAGFLDDQAQQLQVRLLLVRTADRLVAADSASELQGYVLPPAEETLPGQAGRLSIGRYQTSDGQFVTISAAGALQISRIADRFPGVTPRHAVMVAVPHANLAAAWLSLAPRLLVAGLLALFAALPVALWLSRSITRPLARITRASEEMARGHYDQQIPVERQDEIGRLGTAFNLMAKQVSLSHRTLREFLADVSHELRTPLTSIRGFSQAMTDGSLHTPAEYAEAGQVIHEEAGRMARLVEDLLYLSRVESGQFVGDRDPLDLPALVGACVQRAARRATAREVALSFEANTTPPVAGEAHRLEQVVDNLLDNALKHTPPGGHIAVRIAADAAGGGVQLTVHNTGSVIPAEEQERVFDRFYRGHGSPSGEGAGLGLAIARQIVENHGGRIGVVSSAAEGTQFSVWLPAGDTGAAVHRPLQLGRVSDDAGVGRLAAPASDGGRPHGQRAKPSGALPPTP
jgi:two-component system OmpR family sensor kinase